MGPLPHSLGQNKGTTEDTPRDSVTKGDSKGLPSTDHPHPVTGKCIWRHQENSGGGSSATEWKEEKWKNSDSLLLLLSPIRGPVAGNRGSMEEATD